MWPYGICVNCTIIVIPLDIDFVSSKKLVIMSCYFRKQGGNGYTVSGVEYITEMVQYKNFRKSALSYRSTIILIFCMSRHI